MANIPRLHGDVVEGKKLAKFVVDYLESLGNDVESAATVAAAATTAVQAIPPPITITGSGVSGSPEGGYVITSEGPARIAARVAYGV